VAPVTETRAAETRAAETRAADAPAERGAVPDAPAEPVTAPAERDPVTETRAVDTSTETTGARATYAPTSAGTATQTAPPRRRSGGLLGRFRRR
jgi:hypothetical protein